MKQIIITPWGAGFYADFFHLLQGLHIARTYDLQASVFWGANSLYFNGNEVFSQIFDINKIALLQNSLTASEITKQMGLELSDMYKAKDGKPISSDLNEKDYLKMLLKIIEEKGWCIFNRYLFDINQITDDFCTVNKRPKWNFRDLVNDVHKLNDYIISEAASITEKASSYYCIHIRGSEKVRSAKNSAIIAQKYAELLEDLQLNENNVVLLTEDRIVVESFVESTRIDNLIIPSTNREGAVGKNLLGRDNIEQAPAFLSGQWSKEDKFRMAVDVVRDVFIGSKSDFFIASKSNVSTAIKNLLHPNIKVIQPDFDEVICLG